MRLPDGTILMHGSAPYDPKKAHEYYLRVRQLKGRKRGAAPPASTGGRAARQPVRNNPSLARQRANAAAQVAKLQTTLTQLNRKLKEKLAEAKKSAKEAEKPDTAAEKSKKARESKKYRDTHKQELKTQAKKDAAKAGGGSKSDAKKSAGEGSVEEIRAAIDGVQRALSAAKARQHALG